MIRITAAKTAGFCFGVKRAVELVYDTAKTSRTATLGDIIHNADVVRDLEEKGIRVIDRPSDAEPDETVVIRSHGVEDSVLAELERLGISYRDGTCPFVSKIHDIVRRCSGKGSAVIIVGDKDHPEVIGIAGSSETEPYTVSDKSSLYALLDSEPGLMQKPLAMVAQTTCNIKVWDDCSAALSERRPDAEIFRTICSATSQRQQEAAGLAKKSDVMIVIGGRHSSNTRKLYDICSSFCPKCFLIENASELNTIGLLTSFSDKCDISIGVTAGASTPAYIIKEVTNQMSEKLQNDEEFNFEEAIEASFKRLYTGNRVKGYITAVNDTEATVDIAGTKQTGYVSRDEITDDPSLKPTDVLKVGDEVEFIVMKVNDAEGTVALSKKQVDERVGFDKIVKAKEEDAVLEGTVTKVVKGGILVSANGVTVFIPASQATLRRDEKLDDMLRKTVQFKIIEVNEQRGKAVGSIKIVLNAAKEEAKEKFWETAKVGDKFKGEVKSITSYGAFVDLGGIDGMVHISELSWNRIKHPSEVVSVGDVLEVYIKELNKEQGRISLGYKKDEDNPFTKFVNDYHVGDDVDAKIVSITPFGAFAQIVPGIDGLIHISQISDKRVSNVKDVLSVGDEVKARITEIDEDKKRISLSIREVLLENGGSADEGEETGE